MAATGEAGQHDLSDRSVHAFRGTPPAKPSRYGWVGPTPPMEYSDGDDCGGPGGADPFVPRSGGPVQRQSGPGQQCVAAVRNPVAPVGPSRADWLSGIPSSS